MTARTDEAAQKAERQGGRGKRPKPATPDYLQRAALFYLERYASSTDNLRRLLLRKVERSARLHGTDPTAGAQAVEELLGRLRAAGLLNDGLYAEMRARSLLRRGQSLRAIRFRLGQKGLAGPDIEAALEGLREEAADPELAAALAYARKRRIGPFRVARAGPDAGPLSGRDGQDSRRTRDLAALARRGFGAALAIRVVDCADPRLLEAEAAGRPGWESPE